MPNNTWKENKKSQYVDLTVPSGQTCKARRTTPQNLIKLGVLKDLDQLTGIVRGQLIPRAQGAKAATSEEEFMDLLNDPEKFSKILKTVDDLVLYSVVEPKIHPDPADDEEADDNLVYLRDIDLEDKFFIMQFAMGGTSDLRSFRAGSEQSVGDLDSVENLSNET